MDGKSIALLLGIYLAVGIACFFMIRGIRQQPRTSVWYRTRNWLPIVMILFVVGISGLNLFHYPSAIDIATKYEIALSTPTDDILLSTICPEDQAVVRADLAERIYRPTYVLTQMKQSISSESLTDASVLITAQSSIGSQFRDEVHLRYNGALGWCVVRTR